MAAEHDIEHEHEDPDHEPEQLSDEEVLDALPGLEEIAEAERQRDTLLGTPKPEPF